MGAFHRSLMAAIFKQGNRKGNRGPRGVFPPLARDVDYRLTPKSGRASGVPRRSSSSDTSSCLAVDQGGALCRPLSTPSSSHTSTSVPWRERPRDLAASAIMPAATAEVAHATLAGCHRLRCRAQTCATRRSDPDGISDVDRRVFRSAFPLWFLESNFETAAPRG